MSSSLFYSRYCLLDLLGSVSAFVLSFRHADVFLIVFNHASLRARERT